MSHGNWDEDTVTSLSVEERLGSLDTLAGGRKRLRPFTHPEMSAIVYRDLARDGNRLSPVAINKLAHTLIPADRERLLAESAPDARVRQVLTSS